MKRRVISLFFVVMLCVGVASSVAVAESETEKLFIVYPKALSIFSQNVAPLRNASNFGDNRHIMIIGYEIPTSTKSTNAKFGIFVKPSVIEDRNTQTPGAGIGFSVGF